MAQSLSQLISLSIASFPKWGGYPQNDVGDTDPITLRVALEGFERRKVPHVDLHAAFGNVFRSDPWSITTNSTSRYITLEIPRETTSVIVDFVYDFENHTYQNADDLIFTIGPDHYFSKFSVYMFCRDIKVMTGNLALPASTEGIAPERVGYRPGSLKIRPDMLTDVPRNLRIRELP